MWKLLVMGGLISLLRDIKTVYKDLKVTLKLTARIVLKVHGIVDDVEQTVQELKAMVKGLSSKLDTRAGTGEVAFGALVENMESKAILLKTSLVEATSQVFNEDLVRSTQEKWDKVVHYSKQSTEALASIVASSSFDTSRQDNSGAQQADSIEENVSLSDDKEEENDENESNFSSTRALVPILEEPGLPNIKIEEEIQDFEVLPIDIVDSFWKCDVGCFNIDCVDFQHLPTSQLANGEEGSKLRKKKSKKRSKNSKKTKFGRKLVSGTGSEHVPANLAKHHHKKRKQPRENIALEMIFLIALLMEGVAMSNCDLLARESTWNECNYGSRAAEIIELDD